MSDDAQAQEDELLALASIYDGQIFSSEEILSLGSEVRAGQFSAILEFQQPLTVKAIKKLKGESQAVEKSHSVKYLPPIILNFQLPKDYPSQSPPEFTLTCKWLTLHQLSSLCQKLDETWQDNEGMEILFLWTSFLKDDVTDFLDISSTLILNDIVHHRHPNTTCSEKHSEPADAGSTVSHQNLGSSNVVLCNKQKEAPTNYDHCNYKQPPWPCSPDHRAVQDFSTIDLLFPYLIDFDTTQQDSVFQTTCFTCQVCIAEKLGCQCMMFISCEHVYCKDCMKAYFEVQIADGNVQGLTCPDDKCDSQATPSQVKLLVAPELFARYDRLLLQSSLDMMSDIMYCPRRVCDTVVMVDQDSGMGTCPMCNFVFCIFCKLVYHGLSPCRIRDDDIKKLREQYLCSTEEEKKMMERRYGRRAIQQVVEDSYSEEWLQEYSKKCPSCGTHIQKIEGCNKITCTKCRCYFCWLCNTVLSRNNPYSHFNTPESECFNRLFHGVAFDDHDDDEFDDDF